MMSKQYSSVAEMLIGTLSNPQLVDLINRRFDQMKELEAEIEQLKTDLAKANLKNVYSDM